MGIIRILDCTLRDGGCVNDFNFGNKAMLKIKSALEQAHIDIIECGYIDSEQGSIAGRTKWIDDCAVSGFIEVKKKDTEYVAMIDLHRFDVSGLLHKTESKLDGIRLAFHKSDYHEAVAAAKIIQSRGYAVYIQPMVLISYSDNELRELIELVNEELDNCKGFYIVDSFGQMRPGNIVHMAEIVDAFLKPGTSIGLHAHNNQQLSYANAIQLLSCDIKRDIIIDCTVMGMGKGAGNLNTELFAQHVNDVYGERRYKIEPMLHIIDNVLRNIYSQHYWGYSPAYFLSALIGCSPSYAGYYYDKFKLPIEDIASILPRISDKKKISFDKRYAEELYLKYYERYFDDRETVEYLKRMFTDKRLVLIAPGKSLTKRRELLIEKLSNKNEDVITVTINNYNCLGANYSFFTKKNLYQKFLQSGSGKVILTSNVETEGSDEKLIVDFEKWTNYKGNLVNSSLIIFLNLISNIRIKEIQLMGVDGFSLDTSENYMEDEYMKPFTKENIEENNRLVREYLTDLAQRVNITFLTKSHYEFEM